MDDTWDLFISYKTEDSNVVRRIAEAVMANGYRVWFAEYCIPLALNRKDEHETAVQERAREAALSRELARGLRASRRVLVVTNNRWARAAWCQAEALLIGCLKDPRTEVAELRMPSEPAPREVWPFLKEAPCLDYDGDLAKVLAFLHRDLKWFPKELVLPALPPGHPQPLRFGVTLDPGPLSAVDPADFPLASAGRTRRAVGETFIFDGEVAGTPTRLMVHVNPAQTVLGNLSVVAYGNANDRHVRDQYVNFGCDWLAGVGQQPIGLHLRFWGRRSHLGLSSQLSASDQVHRSERRYAIILRRHCPCLDCGKTEWEHPQVRGLGIPALFPYYRKDLTGEARVFLICTTPSPGYRWSVPLDQFRPDLLLAKCPRLGPAGACGGSVLPDEAKLAELLGDEGEARFVCLNCGARLVVPAGQTGDVGELDISVVFDLPAGEVPAPSEPLELVPAPKKFLELAGFADAIIDSLDYQPRRDLWTREAALVLAARGLVGAVIYATLDYAQVRYDYGTVQLVLAALCGAAAMGAAASLLGPSLRHHTLFLGLRLGRWWPRLLPSCGRLCDEFREAVLGSVASLLVSVLLGLLMVGWLAVPLLLYRHESSLWTWGITGALIYALGETAVGLQSRSRRGWNQ